MTNKSTPMIKQFVALVKMKPFDNSLDFVENLAESIVSDLGLKVVKKVSHVFSPTGITLGYILSQSHLVIHTYPEDGLIHVDLAVCSNHGVNEFENSLKYALTAHEVYSVEVRKLNLTAK